MQLRDHKILITGLTGQVARPVALDLAKHNEIWGIARFTNPDVRALRARSATTDSGARVHSPTRNASSRSP